MRASTFAHLVLFLVLDLDISVAIQHESRIGPRAAQVLPAIGAPASGTASFLNPSLAV